MLPTRKPQEEIDFSSSFCNENICCMISIYRILFNSNPLNFQTGLEAPGISKVLLTSKSSTQNRHQPQHRGCGHQLCGSESWWCQRANSAPGQQWRGEHHRTPLPRSKWAQGWHVCSRPISTELSVPESFCCVTCEDTANCLLAVWSASDAGQDWNRSELINWLWTPSALPAGTHKGHGLSQG